MPLSYSLLEEMVKGTAAEDIEGGDLCEISRIHRLSLSLDFLITEKEWVSYVCTSASIWCS